MAEHAGSMEATDLLSRFDRLMCYSDAMWELADRLRDGLGDEEDWQKFAEYLGLRAREEALAR